MLVVRLGANMFIAWDVSRRGGTVDIAQFAAWHAVFFLCLAVWNGTARVSVVVRRLETPFFHDSVRFSRFRRRASFLALIRASFLIPVCGSVVLFSLGAGAAAAAQSSDVLSATAAGPMGMAAVLTVPVALAVPFAVSRMLLGLRLSVDSLRLIQLSGVVILMAINPDFGRSGDQAVTTVMMTPLPAAGAIPLTVGATALFGVPLAIGAAIHIGNRARRSVSNRPVRKPMLRLYSHLAGGTWIGLYVAMLPGFLSSNIRSPGLVVYLVAFCVSVVLFGGSTLVRTELILGRWWCGSIVQPSHRRLLLPVAAVHVALALPGVAAMTMRVAAAVSSGA